MAILDESLARIVADMQPAFEAANLKRVRGGIARGIAWAEVSGRAADGAWIELRLHHKPMELRLQAGLLAYQPLSRGGRTVVLGEVSIAYRNSPDEAAPKLLIAVRAMLTNLETQTCPS